MSTALETVKNIPSYVNRVPVVRVTISLLRDKARGRGSRGGYRRSHLDKTTNQDLPGLDRVRSVGSRGRAFSRFLQLHVACTAAENLTDERPKSPGTCIRDDELLAGDVVRDCWRDRKDRGSVGDYGIIPSIRPRQDAQLASRELVRGPRTARAGEGCTSRRVRTVRTCGVFVTDEREVDIKRRIIHLRNGGGFRGDKIVRSLKTSDIHDKICPFKRFRVSPSIPAKSPDR